MEEPGCLSREERNQDLLKGEMTDETRPEACTKCSTHARDLSWSKMGESWGVGGRREGKWTEKLAREFCREWKRRETEVTVVEEEVLGGG
jgi:hypothetical protein